MRKFSFTISFVIIFSVVAGYSYFGSSELIAEGDSGNPYDDIEVDAGTWNDGQAALWDLNLIDHFHFFGPKERVKGHKPEQPIKFSHVTHVQKIKWSASFVTGMSQSLLTQQFLKFKLVWDVTR